MIRIKSSATLFLLAFVLTSNTTQPARAGEPCDPNLFIIPNVIVSPDGALAYRIIAYCDGPIPGLQVTLSYSQVVQPLCRCTGAPAPPFSGVTDANGEVTFNIAGGGCIDPNQGSRIQVFMNNVLVREIGQVSPDVLPGTGPPCASTLSDAVDFTGPLATGMYSFCHDLNSDLACGLSDAVILTPYVSLSIGCE